MVKIGIIGGSGLDNPTILLNAREINVNTPYGKPSSSLKVGNINDVDVVLLARHGRDHSIMPSNVNNQANIWALKEQGCTHILASTACGSLREEIKPGDLVFIDQFIDRTTKRKKTFYEKDRVCHIPMAEPFCDKLRNVLADAAKELGLRFHKEGTIITIEGPRFSTKAESKLFRTWDADVINMSTVPEVVLAREAGICYAAVAMATDYDCWRESTEAVTWEEIVKTFTKNAENVIQLFLKAMMMIRQEECKCREDIKTAVVGGQEIGAKKEFDLHSTIRTVPHWPKQGIMFRDITTLLQNPEAFRYSIEKLKERYSGKNINKIAGIESRGFIFGAALAYELGLPFVLIRKKGKLPYETISQEYALEYGTDKIEIHKDALEKWDTILIVDDLLATGGTCLAACQLVEKLGASVEGTAFVVNLPELKGTERLKNYKPFFLVEFQGG
ncbi:S-methyl-5'-thioadenosine phosphorylase [Candidatus Woesearchaeota archaeon]|nr:S-methyl-5'-thioadenosine phosphorylase [Candidatus Woesearchaeota archaeon]